MNVVSSADDAWDVFVRTPAQELAQLNSAALDGLFTQLKAAVHHASLDTQSVSERINVTEEEAREILDGQADLTLSDLEVLLVAVRGRLKVEVEPFVAPSRVHPPAASDWRTVKTRRPVSEGRFIPWRTHAGV